MSKPSGFKLTHASSLLLHLIRGGTSQAVVVGHALRIFDIKEVLYLQNAAVLVFFILSGVVIPYSSFSKAQKSGGYSFASYFIDRFSRIYMGLVPALLFVLILELFGRQFLGIDHSDPIRERLYSAGSVVTIPYAQAFDTRTFLGNLLMLQDFPAQVAISQFFTDRLSVSLSWLLPITSFGMARPLWTVAIEWWIYLLFGWIAFGRRLRKTRPWLFWPVLAFLLIVPAHNWVWSGRGNGLAMVWGMGLLVYVLLSRLPLALPQRETALLAGLFLFSGMTRLYQTREGFDLLVAGLLATALYFGLRFLQDLELAIPKWVDWPITFNADVSYMLYLVHYSILDVIFRWRGVGKSNAVLAFVLSNLVAVLMHQAFDRHHRAFGSWLRKRLRVP